MEHSELFEKIKMYYRAKVWPLTAVKNAVKKGLITPEEYKEITGKVYKQEENYGIKRNSRIDEFCRLQRQI